MSEWWELALCAKPGVDPDWWSVDSVLSEDNRRAQRICGDCQVAEECWRDNFGTVRNSIIAGWWINNRGGISKQSGQPIPGGLVLVGSRS